MKKTLSIFACFYFSAGLLFAGVNGISFSDHALVINSEAPPVSMVVVDSGGNQTGADSAKFLDIYGRGLSINNIPGSYVDQVNLIQDEGPDFDLPSKDTSWTVWIMDEPAQSYTVNLLGNSQGVAALYIGGSSRSGKRIPVSKYFIIIAPGEMRSAKIDYDPASAKLAVTPEGGGVNLVQDTQYACSTGSISPTEAREVLEALAAEVEKAITDGDTNKEAQDLTFYLRILDRLHHWGHAGYVQNWLDLEGYPECAHLYSMGLNGSSFFAKNPVYSALKLDVETLPGGLPSLGNQGGQGGQGH